MDARAILEKKGHAVVTVSPESTIREAMALLIRHNVGSLVVVGHAGVLAGIITDRDIFRLAFEHEGRIMDLPISAVMRREPVTAQATDSVERLKKLITENRVRHLPVMDEGRLVGIVSIGDVLLAQNGVTASQNRLLRASSVASCPASYVAGGPGAADHGM